MGADMCLAVCEDPYNLDAAKEIIEYRLGLIRGEELMEIAENYFCWELDDAADVRMKELRESDLFHINNFEEKVREEVAMDLGIRKIREALEDIIYSSDNGYRRDIASMLLGGVHYLFSGGMSWGDNPSEAMTPINILYESGVLDGLGAHECDYEAIKNSLKC